MGKGNERNHFCTYCNLLTKHKIHNFYSKLINKIKFQCIKCKTEFIESTK
jgi:hypothetical protein